MDILLAALKAIPVVGNIVTAIQNWLHDREVKNAQQASDQRDNAVAGIGETQAADQTRDDAVAAQHADSGSVRKPGADSVARGSDGIS